MLGHDHHHHHRHLVILEGGRGGAGRGGQTGCLFLKLHSTSLQLFRPFAVVV